MIVALFKTCLSFRLTLPNVRKQQKVLLRPSVEIAAAEGSDPAAEVSGLDMPEMGALAYPDFLEAQGAVFYTTGGSALVELKPSDAASTREEVGAS